MRTDDIAVESRDERPGLRAREECDGLALDVVEDLRAQVEDEALPDLRREPARDEPESGVQQREQGDHQCRDGHDRGVARRHAVVDDPPEEQWLRNGQQ